MRRSIMNADVSGCTKRRHRDGENGEHDPNADREDEPADHAPENRSSFFSSAGLARTKRRLRNDTGAEVRAGAFKLSRSLRSLADEVAAVDAAETGQMRSGSVEAVGEDDDRPSAPLMWMLSRKNPAKFVAGSDEKRQRMITDWPANALRSVVNGLNTAVAVPLPGSAFDVAVVTPLNAPCAAS